MDIRSTGRAGLLPAIVISPWPPVSVYRWPYAGVERLAQPRIGVIDGVIVLELTPADLMRLDQDAIDVLTREFPSCPVVVRLLGVEAVLSDVAFRAGRLSIAALILPNADLNVAVRHQLTRDANLATNVVEWMFALGRAKPGPSAVVVRELLLCAAQPCTIAELCERLLKSGRTVRSQLLEAGLPSPRSWLQVGRALHACMQLQRDPHTSLFAVAIERGYSDHGALGRQLTRFFGLRSSEVRRLLGWQPLMYRWLYGDRFRHDLN